MPSYKICFDALSFFFLVCYYFAYLLNIVFNKIFVFFFFVRCDVVEFALEVNISASFSDEPFPLIPIYLGIYPETKIGKITFLLIGSRFFLLFDDLFFNVITL